MSHGVVSHPYLVAKRPPGDDTRDSRHSCRAAQGQWMAKYQSVFVTVKSGRDKYQNTEAS